MQYLVEVERIPDEWRLQADGSWRCIDADKSVRETDRKLNCLIDLQPYQADDFMVNLAGEHVRANPSGTVHVSDLCGIQFRVVRGSTPRTPTKEELLRVIKSGNDRMTNTLVINLDGQFKLKPWVGENWPIFDLDIAVRMETSSAGNGYVGPEAAADPKYIDRLYRDYLWLWNRHLETGLMNIFEDGTPASLGG